MSKILIFLFIINSVLLKTEQLIHPALNFRPGRCKVLSGKDGASPQGSYHDLDVSKLESTMNLNPKVRCGEEDDEQLEELDIDVGTEISCKKVFKF